jgi:hypothetical protein
MYRSFAVGRISLAERIAHLDRAPDQAYVVVLGFGFRGSEDGGSHLGLFCYRDCPRRRAAAVLLGLIRLIHKVSRA